MKKCEIPKPKFDVGDLMAYKHPNEMAEGFKSSETRAGNIEQISINKNSSGWRVSYVINGIEVIESEAKKIRL